MEQLPIPILREILMLVVQDLINNPPSRIRRDIPALLFVCKKFRNAIESGFFWEHSIRTAFQYDLPKLPTYWKILYARSTLFFLQLITQKKKKVPLTSIKVTRFSKLKWRGSSISFTQRFSANPQCLLKTLCSKYFRFYSQSRFQWIFHC